MPLMRGASAGDTTRDYLAPFRDESPQGTDVFIVDIVDLFLAEKTYFPAGKPSAVTTTRPGAVATWSVAMTSRFIIFRPFSH